MSIALSLVLLIDYGLRDYGTAKWDGGDAGCLHIRRAPTQALAESVASVRGGGHSAGADNRAGEIFGHACGKCGATRVDRQLGLEATPDEYVAKLVEGFREVRRVLRWDGTCWINLGDSYASSWPCNRRNVVGNGSLPNGKREARAPRMGGSLKEKDLIGIPWMVAFALRADGWHLRSEITWCKRAPMPESVLDRPTSATEKIFLLTKSLRYFYDSEAVREASDPAQEEHNQRYAKPYVASDLNAGNRQPGNVNSVGIHSRPGSGGRNQRNFWLLGPEPFSAAHFATFVTEIPRRAILAGTSERGCCPACGGPWVRQTEETSEYATVKAQLRAKLGPDFHMKRAGIDAIKGSGTGGNPATLPQKNVTTGWAPSCRCEAGEPIPCTVLDPFAGAFTTSLVSERLNRDSIGIELSPEYAAMARARLIGDCPLFTAIEGGGSSVAAPSAPIVDKQAALGKRTYTGFNARWDAREKAARDAESAL